MSRVCRTISARPTAAGFIALAAVIACATGCGGKGEKQKPETTFTDNDAGPTVDPCNLDATLVTHPFGCTPGPNAHCADFEGYPVGNGGMPTGWFAYIDQMAINPEFINPSTGAISTAALTASSDSYTRLNEDDNECGKNQIGQVAYHMLAKGQNIWGPQFGVKFTGLSDGPLPPVDLDTFAGEEWEGMAFWIKKGNDHTELEPTGTSMFVSLRDPNAISSGSDSVPPCNDASNFDSRKCDPFGVGISFDTEWRYVMIAFDDMKQRGYGVHQDKLDRSQVENLYFSMDIGDGANGNWNVWVDDVVLYRYKR